MNVYKSGTLICMGKDIVCLEGFCCQRVVLVVFRLDLVCYCTVLSCLKLSKCQSTKSNNCTIGTYLEMDLLQAT